MYAWYCWYKKFDDPLDYMESLVIFVFDFRDPLFWAIVLLGNSIFIVCMLSLFTGLCCSCRKIAISKQNTNTNDNDYDCDSNDAKIAATSPASQDAVKFEYGGNGNKVEMASIGVEIQGEMRQQSVNSVHSHGSSIYNQYNQYNSPYNSLDPGLQYTDRPGGGAAPAAAFSGHYAKGNPYGRIDRGNSNGGVSIGESESGIMIQAQASYENRYAGTGYNPDFANSLHGKAPGGGTNSLSVNHNNNSSRHLVNDNSGMYSESGRGMGIGGDGNGQGFISEFEGHYKQGYLIILNTILIIATAIYEWVVTPQTSITSLYHIKQ